MKNLIITCAICIVFIIFSAFQFDSNLMSEEKEQLKFNVDEAAATAGLYYDEEEYANGNKIYIDNDANEALETILKINMGLDDSMIPTGNNYWTDKIHYSVYYFDDSFIMRQYSDGYFIKDNSFIYGDTFTDPETGYIKSIDEPTVIVTVNAGEPKMRLSFLKDLVKVKETSAYEYISY